MEKLYSTGKFAKLADLSERTIRYYDEIGLLKPSFKSENGYRKYKKDDFNKLQKIVSLKQLGFSLDEIMAMIIESDDKSMECSLKLQSELLYKEINHLSNLKEAVDMTLVYAKNHVLKWEHIVNLIKLTNENEKVVNHYRDAYNLEVRIRLHEMYSKNSLDWYEWIMKSILMKPKDKILEIGAGNGGLWNKNLELSKNREIFISDISQGMVDKAKENLSDDFSFMVFDAQKIPFKKDYFDIVIANHMLFYLKDLSVGLGEVNRVLKENGLFYCSTYGITHMQEISEIAKEFDPKITLSENSLVEKFGLENGKKILMKFFSKVELHVYEDALEITEAKPLFEYILSCHGNQKELLAGKMDLFLEFLERKICSYGKVYVTKHAGLFICRKA